MSTELALITLSKCGSDRSSQVIGVLQQPIGPQSPPRRRPLRPWLASNEGNGHRCVSLSMLSGHFLTCLKAGAGNPRGEETDMATLLLLTNDMRSSAEILPAWSSYPTTSKSPRLSPRRCWMHRPRM